MKYKLIKEYPGSSKLGTISNGLLELQLYPEFWEEVKEKTYEILSWYFGDMNITKEPDGSAREYHIHSVKRLSDGEVFTVGGKCYEGTNKVTIEQISLYEWGDSKLHKRQVPWLQCSDGFGIALQYARHREKPILTTEDGVEMYEWDTVYFIDYDDDIEYNWIVKIHTVVKDSSLGKYHGQKAFSTRKAAEEYIELNKPVFTRQQLLDFIRANTHREIHYGELIVDISYDSWLEFISNENK